MEQWHNYTIKLLNLYEQRHQREIEQLITIFSANQLDTSLPKNSQKLEEIDEFYFSAYCKLYRFDKFLKEYIELGFGEIKLNKEKNSCGFRVLMENTKSGQKYADFWVTERLSVNMKQRIPTVYSWKCRDYSKKVCGEDVSFYARFSDATIGKEFASAIKKAVSKIYSYKQKNFPLLA